jgi:hypothetical protein
MRNPVNFEIRRADYSWTIIEVVPVLIEEGKELIPTGMFKLYLGFPEHDSPLYDAQALRERYMESIDIEGNNHPDLLGELHFPGVGYFEWKYHGQQLVEEEVLQVIELIQDYSPAQAAAAAPLAFLFGNGQEINAIRIVENEGGFGVFIDEVFIAQIEMPYEHWEITAGEISDRDLLMEIIRRLKINTAN